MAYELTDRAFKLTLPHVDKMVLANLARYADHNGRNAFPSITRQQRDLALSSRTIERALRRLEETYHLIEDSRPKYKKQGGRKHTVNYTLCLRNWSQFEEEQDEENPVSVTGFSEENPVIVSETPSLCHRNPVTVSRNPVSVTGESVKNLSPTQSIYQSKPDGEIEEGRGRRVSKAKPKPSSKVDPTTVLEQIDQTYKDRTGCDFRMWDEDRYMSFYKRQIRKHGAAFVLDVVEAFADGDENHDGMNCPAGVLMARWREYAEQLAAAEVA